MTRMTDEKIDTAVGLILRIGVIVAAVLVAGGGMGYLIQHPAVPPAQELKSFRGIFGGVAARQPLFIVQLGLVVLMATPVVRVIACAIGFGLERDRTYLTISAIVLALLLVSIA